MKPSTDPSPDLKHQILCAVAELSELVVKNDSLGSLIDVVTHHLINLTGASSTFVHLVKGEGAYLELIACAGEATVPVGQRLEKGQGAAGTAWATTSSVYIADYEAFAQRVSAVSGVTQACALPMLVEEEVIGVLGIMFSTEGSDLASEIDTLQLYANLTSIALWNARLISQTRQELRLSNSISKLIEQIAGCKSTSALFEISATGILEYFEASCVDIWSMSHDSIDELIGVWSGSESSLAKNSKTGSVPGEAHLRDFFDNTSTVSRSLSELRFLSMPYFEIPFSAPGENTFVLLDQGEACHLLRVHRHEDAQMMASEMNLLRSIVGHISMAARLHRLVERATFKADHDLLTGLPNRHRFFAELEQAVQQADTRQQPFALYFIDLDGFKAVNDSLGHAQGDQLLVETTTRFRSVLSTQHVFSRFGGDEFVLLINLERKSDARELASSLIQSLDEPIELSESAAVSASIGCVIYNGEGLEAAELLTIADKAMYQAKHLGKGQFCIGAVPVQPSAPLTRSGDKQQARSG